MNEQQVFRSRHAVRLRASVAAALAACWIALLLTGSRPAIRPPSPSTPSTVVEFVDFPEELVVPDPPREIQRPDRDLAVTDPEPVVPEIEPAPVESNEPSWTDAEPSNAAVGPAPFVVFDEAPRVRRMAMPEYPEVARAGGIEGWVVCAIHLDAEGRVTDVRVLDSSSDLFHDAARTAIFASSFSPARQSGQPVACVVSQRIVFELR